MVSVVLLGSAKTYLDFLWFSLDVKHPEVFSTEVGARSILLLLSFLGLWGLFQLSLSKALGQSLVYMQAPSGAGQRLASNAMALVQEYGKVIVRLAAPVFALFTALTFSNEWQTMLLANHARSFGISDPIFGKDLSFFVFMLPWYRALANTAFGALFLCTLLTLGIYLGTQALASVARLELGRPHVRAHVSLLIGGTLLAYSLVLWLKCYEYGLSQGAQFTGAGYAQSQELTAQFVVAVLLALTGVGAIVSFRASNPLRVPLGGGILVGLVALLGMGIWPALVQRLKVEPDKLNVEGPFAARAIKMTRYAYDLDRIETRDFSARDEPTQTEVRDSSSTLSNMRLWDPYVLRQAIEAVQAFKPYYTFNDVDIDRYQINGKQTMVMLSPRDIRLSGINSGARTWVNERLQYTHGYGVAVSPVNESSSLGYPAFLVKDIPLKTAADLPVSRPQIYFSDFPPSEGGYVLVKTKVKELDYPSQDGTVSTTWQGDSGIPVGGFFRRLLMSAALGDGNLLVSDNVSSETRLLMRRSIRDRVSTLYPFLTLDYDPYLVVLSGRLLWVADAYTTSDMVPYSSTVTYGPKTFNYLRNSVKVTVDAYTGETNAYAMEPDEPILRAYRSIYPRLFKDKAEMPAGLEEHLRYPEVLFQIQASQLTLYHVTDSTAFLNNADAWDIALEQGLDRTKNQIQPYYVQMELPDEPQGGFLQILPFTPAGKSNMSGWLAAHCDPGQYGKMVLYKFSRGQNLPGPEQMEQNFAANEQIANINRQLANEQSDIISGNLLVIPIGSSVMYVEPLFLKGTTQGLQAAPQLRKVVLAVSDRIVVGDTYSQALSRLFSGSESAPAVAPQSAPPTGQKPPSAADLAAVREALGLLDKADEALREGDFAKYGQLQKQARQKLEELAAK